MSDYLEHHGVKGMQWGVRNYQNPDGSLTAKGRQHYGVSNYARDRLTARSEYRNRNQAIQRRYDNELAKIERPYLRGQQLNAVDQIRSAKADYRARSSFDDSRKQYRSDVKNANSKLKSSVKEKTSSPEFKAKAKKAAIIGGSIVAAGLAAYGAYKLSKVMANNAATIRAKNFLNSGSFRTSVYRGHAKPSDVFASRDNYKLQAAYDRAVNKVASKYAGSKTGSFKDSIKYLRKGDMDSVPVGLRQELMAELRKSGIYGNFVEYDKNDFRYGIGGMAISQIFD